MTTLSTMNLQTVVMSKQGLDKLGYYVIGFVYISYGFGSLLSPSVLKLFGVNMAIILGGISNTVWILSTTFSSVAGDLMIDLLGGD